MAAGRPPAGTGGSGVPSKVRGEVKYGYEGHPDVSGAQDRAWKRAIKGRSAGQDIEEKRRWTVRVRSQGPAATPGPPNFYATK